MTIELKIRGRTISGLVELDCRTHNLDWVRLFTYGKLLTLLAILPIMSLGVSYR